MNEREKLLNEIATRKQAVAAMTAALKANSEGIKEQNMKIAGLEAAIEQLGDPQVDALFEKFDKFTPEQKDMFFDKLLEGSWLSMFRL